MIIRQKTQKVANRTMGPVSCKYLPWKQAYRGVLKNKNSENFEKIPRETLSLSPFGKKSLTLRCFFIFFSKNLERRLEHL